MLNIVQTYGSEFSLSFNRNKCGVLICNKPEEEVEDFELGNQIITLVNPLRPISSFLHVFKPN